MTFREKIKGKLTPGNGFKLSKPVEKFLINLLFAMVMAGITYTISQLEGGSISLGQSLITGMGIAALNSAKNTIKHWKDKKEEELEN